MGNHFHLLVRMCPEYKFSDEDIKKRYEGFYGDDRILTEGQIPSLREKLSSLSEFVREIKVGFARYYNRRHNRRGYFLGRPLQKCHCGQRRNACKLPGIHRFKSIACRHH